MNHKWKKFWIVVLTAFASLSWFYVDFEPLRIMSIVIAFIGGMIFIDAVYNSPNVHKTNCQFKNYNVDEEVCNCSSNHGGTHGK